MLGVAPPSQSQERQGFLYLLMGDLYEPSFATVTGRGHTENIHATTSRKVRSCGTLYSLLRVASLVRLNANIHYASLPAGPT